MSSPFNRKPWSMKWIVLTIAVFIVGYTYVTLAFRKPNKAAEPYQDAKDRTTVSRLRTAGYTRIPLEAQRPAEPAVTRKQVAGSPAEVREAIGGLTPELNDILIDKPVLPDDFNNVAAGETATAMLPYQVQYNCLLPDNKQLLGEIRAYVKGEQVVIVTSFEHLAGDLLSRTKESTVLVTVPAGTLKAGTYEVLLIGKRQSKHWKLTVH